MDAMIIIEGKVENADGEMFTVIVTKSDLSKTRLPEALKSSPSGFLQARYDTLLDELFDIVSGSPGRTTSFLRWM
jgi:hypothetical protein